MVAGNSAAYFRGDGGGITNVPTLDEPNLKRIRGRVSNIGVATGAPAAILQGKGFTATKAGLGFLSITFTVPFSDVPVVVASDEGGGAYKCILQGLTRTNFSILTARNYLDTADLDSTISFIAIGPK